MIDKKQYVVLNGVHIKIGELIRLFGYRVADSNNDQKVITMTEAVKYKNKGQLLDNKYNNFMAEVVVEVDDVGNLLRPEKVSSAFKKQINLMLGR